MKNVFSFFCAILFGVLLASGSVAGQERNSIIGYVFDDKRVPVANLFVELQNDFYGSVARTRTGGSGTFSFNGLPQGRYIVKVLTFGTSLEEQSQSVSLMPASPIPGRGAVSEQINFYLQARRTVSAGGAPGVLFVQDVPAKAEAIYKEALDEFTKKNDPAALGKLKEAIETFPEYFLALDRLGSEYLSRGHFEAAYLLLAKAATVNPRSFTSIVGSGVGLYRLGRVDKAIEQFRAALAIEKNSGFAHMWMGIALHSKGKLQEALTSLNKSNELNGASTAEVHFQLARVYKDLNDFKKAADSLEQYLKVKPSADNAAEIRKAITSLRNKS